MVGCSVNVRCWRDEFQLTAWRHGGRTKDSAEGECEHAQ
jgi:hypothetical protein